MFAFPILFCFCAEIYPKKTKQTKTKKKNIFHIFGQLTVEKEMLNFYDLSLH